MVYSGLRVNWLKKNLKSKISWHFPFKRQEASRDQIMHIYTVLNYLLPENIYLSREKEFGEHNRQIYRDKYASNNWANLYLSNP